MVYVIYDNNTAQVLAMADTLTTARRQHTRAHSALGICTSSYYIVQGPYYEGRTDTQGNETNIRLATRAEYNEHVDYLVTVKSLMTGKEVHIRRSDVGGCCDPSRERYWSM